MAVLSRHAIDERRKLLVGNESSLVITPILDNAAFDEDSIDLRLGTHFLMPQIPPQPFVDPNSPGGSVQSYLRLHIPLGSYFVLPARPDSPWSHTRIYKAPIRYLRTNIDEILCRPHVHGYRNRALDTSAVPRVPHPRDSQCVEHCDPAVSRDSNRSINPS